MIGRQRCLKHAERHCQSHLLLLLTANSQFYNGLWTPPIGQTSKHVNNSKRDSVFKNIFQIAVCFTPESDNFFCWFVNCYHSMKAGFSFSMFYTGGKSQLEKQDCVGLFAPYWTLINLIIKQHSLQNNDNDMMFMYNSKMFLGGFMSVL